MYKTRLRFIGLTSTDGLSARSAARWRSLASRFSTMRRRKFVLCLYTKTQFINTSRQNITNPIEKPSYEKVWVSLYDSRLTRLVWKRVKPGMKLFCFSCKRDIFYNIGILMFYTGWHMSLSSHIHCDNCMGTAHCQAMSAILIFGSCDDNVFTNYCNQILLVSSCPSYRLQRWRRSHNADIRRPSQLSI